MDLKTVKEVLEVSNDLQDVQSVKMQPFVIS